MTKSSLLCVAAILGSAVAGSATAQIEPVDAVTAYATAWAEPDEGKRRALLEKGWADDGVYMDPTAHVEGREALLQHIAGFLATMGEAKLERSSGVEVHHDVLRFQWRIVTPDGTVVADGFDYGELAEDGRLKRIVGFFGPFPGLE
jgi:hypothetical protein